MIKCAQIVLVYDFRLNHQINLIIEKHDTIMDLIIKTQKSTSGRKDC